MFTLSHGLLLAGRSPFVVVVQEGIRLESPIRTCSTTSPSPSWRMVTDPPSAVEVHFDTL